MESQWEVKNAFISIHPMANLIQFTECNSTEGIYKISDERFLSDGSANEAVCKKFQPANYPENYSQFHVVN